MNIQISIKETDVNGSNNLEKLSKLLLNPIWINKNKSNIFDEILITPISIEYAKHELNIIKKFMTMIHKID